MSQEVKSCYSINFIMHQLQKTKTVPEHYYTGRRKAQILHTRLKTNCSALNIDLFTRNVADSLLCHCGSIEDTQHFFFHCGYYTVQRNLLLNATPALTVPSLRSFMFEDTSLSNECNSAFSIMFKLLFLHRSSLS